MQLQGFIIRLRTSVANPNNFFSFYYKELAVVQRNEFFLILFVVTNFLTQHIL